MKNKRFFRDLEQQVGVDYLVLAKQLNRQVGMWQFIAVVAIITHLFW